jgi:hypothetical protein
MLDLLDSAIKVSEWKQATLPPPDGSVPIFTLPNGGASLHRIALLHASFAYFMSELRDEAGNNLRVEPHHEEWCALFQHDPFLVLMAPRDHSKTWTSVSYLLWRVWRHNRDPLTGQIIADLPDGRFEAVLFSLTLDQASTFFELFRSLLLANLDLFADIAPTAVRQTSGRRDVWSSRRIRLRNLALVSIRAYRTSTRGLHPDLLILDDVLDDKTTLTKYQRDKGWRYFGGTLLPMNARQIIVIGTALHYDDLLHRLRPDPKKPNLLKIGRRRVQVHWVKYRAVNWDTGQVLWPWKHDLVDLKGKQAFDPILFAREYQNDPVDDSASIFPLPLTNRAIAQGSGMTFLPYYRKQFDEVVVGGMDIAISGEVGADYTVIWVAVVNRNTGARRVLWGYREQGLSFDDQVQLLSGVCTNYAADLVIVEENGFQKWLHGRTMRIAATSGRIFGHRTGQEKANWEQGVPSVRMALENGLWSFPSGDEASAALAHLWQAEMHAFGWKDGKLQGVGEHDDAVMAWWFLDRAIRLVEDWLFNAGKSGPDYVTGHDVGIEPVRIGRGY